MSTLLIVDAMFALAGLGHWLIASTRFADASVIQGVAIMCVIVLVLVGSMFDGRTPISMRGERVRSVSHNARLVPRLSLSTCWLGAILVLCLFAPWLPLHDSDAIDLARSHAPPAPSALAWGRCAGSRYARLAGSRRAHRSAGCAVVKCDGLCDRRGYRMDAWSWSPVVALVCVGLAHGFLRAWPPVVLLMLLALVGWPDGYVALAIALGLMIAPGVATAFSHARPANVQVCRMQAGLHLIAEIIRGFGVSLALVALLGFMRLTPPDDATNWGTAIA